MSTQSTDSPPGELKFKVTEETTTQFYDIICYIFEQMNQHRTADIICLMRLQEERAKNEGHMNYARHQIKSAVVTHFIDQTNG